jgi:uncharacterized Ntn-hydrolase superfamily protein
VTFSIAARCPTTGELGVAALTNALGVGKLVVHARARVGAAATQAEVNPYLGIDVLARLADGVPAPQAVREVLAGDPGRDHRQLGVVDRDGTAVAHTGPEAPGWAGHRVGDGMTVQGNRLESADVVAAAHDAFLASEGELVDRLIQALAAGLEHGGDAEGHRSAGLTVVDREAYPLWDLRIDHDDDPLARLREEAELLGDELIPQIRRMPTRAHPLGGLEEDPDEQPEA